MVTSYGALLKTRLAWRDALAARHHRRGAGDQESRRQADPRRQGAESRKPHRAHRHAGREQSARSVVDLRFPQSRAARLIESVRRLRQTPRRAHAALLCAAAQARRALHPEAHEDRPQHHRRPSRQDGGQGLLLHSAANRRRSIRRRWRPSRSSSKRRAMTWDGAVWCSRR